MIAAWKRKPSTDCTTTSRRMSVVTTDTSEVCAATEIVKYYLQLHFHIKHDYRNFYLLQRGNFYQSN